MISYDFEYYRPECVDEAVSLFYKLDAEGKRPVYYSGGTEIVSFARVNQLVTGAVIDIKAIPECKKLEVQEDKIIIGAAVSLNKLCEADIFPLLTEVARQTADHTIRNQSTAGGNLCGRIPYRETVLPFLLCDSLVVIAGKNGVKNIPVNQVFHGVMKLHAGELLLQLITDKEYTQFPFLYIRKTKQEKIDYPLAAVAAVKKDKKIRAAFSGIGHFPFRSSSVENYLNDENTITENKINNALSHLPTPIINDLLGSSGYREYVLKNMLNDVLCRLGG